ncbi:mRNA export factor-like [Rhopilema esculentum]|uniref:mRNA export factor-like n=1 Tax=Rhopilema esculentum TaxID=499914 RepID=UPI0031DB867F|eukprot:gene5399-564_t
MFGTTSSAFGATSAGSSLFGSTATNAANPNKDLEVSQPGDDTISSVQFSPKANFLVASSWDNNIRCWEIQQTGQSVAKAMQSHTKPILDSCWHDDGTKVFTAGADNMAKMWDLQSNQATQVAQHDAPIKTCHWIQAPNYQCLMTGSWDKSLRFWDLRQPTPVLSLDLKERCYSADVVYPMGVVTTAQKGIIVYQLENTPSEFKRIESPLKYQHRCISIFRDKKNAPTGFALGSVEGRVAIQYINPQNPRDNFTFKCHRTDVTTTAQTQDIFAVNDIAFNPQHGTLATVGSDGRFSFWDKDARTKLKTSEQCQQPITCCGFNSTGDIFVYAVGYDWAKGHEYFNPQTKPVIYLRKCSDELKPRNKK